MASRKTDSPGNSSSSDDFASYLEEVIDSATSEPEALEEDLESTGVKRVKVEASSSNAEGHPEQKIAESSSEIICQHPGSINGLCIVCGSEVEEESGVALTYIHKGLRLSDAEIFRLRNSDFKNLVQDKKLYLVLDLDHTLLNSVHLQNLTAVDYLRCQGSSSQDVAEGSLFKLEDYGLMTKLRPFVRKFLTEARKMFEMSIYTMGDRPYALAMAKLLDPKGDIFWDRIISRDDGTHSHKKDLDVVLSVESAVLILDDSENAWPDCKDNLILMERYNFFRSSCNQFGFECESQSLYELMSDESESEGALATILKVLTQVHRLYFEEPADSIDRDVRQLLKRLRKEILKDCKIVFSYIFEMSLEAENQPLWKIAEQLGATCSKTIDSSVTHVVSRDVGTEKSRWAIKEKKFLVRPKWIQASNYMWRKAPEENFRLSK